MNFSNPEICISTFAFYLLFFVIYFLELEFSAQFPVKGASCFLKPGFAADSFRFIESTIS